MHFAIVRSSIIAKFCFASSFAPDIEANFMVTGLTARDKKYYWQTLKWLLVSSNQNNDDDKFDTNTMEILDKAI